MSGTPGPNEMAARLSVEAAKALDSTYGTLLVTLARSVDADPGNAGLLREYRIAEAAFRVTTGGGASDSFTELMSKLAD